METFFGCSSYRGEFTKQKLSQEFCVNQFGSKLISTFTFLSHLKQGTVPILVVGCRRWLKKVVEESALLKRMPTNGHCISCLLQGAWGGG